MSGVFASYFDKQAEREKLLAWRYPWFNVMYNYMIALTMVALVIGFAVWGLDVRTNNRAEAMTAYAMATYQAEQQAIEQAKAQEDAAKAASEDTIRANMATALAKLFYGADRFRTKYGYDESDFMTLARCVFNRVENGAYSDSIFEVIDQPEQWVGYYSNNPVLADYYSMALKAVTEWRTETTKPIDNSFLWAELTPNGIYLKSDFHADGYARRWRA